MHNKFRPHSILTVIGLFLTFLIASCGPAKPDKVAQPPLRIGYTQWVGYGPLFLANEKGFFKQEGVNVELVPYDSIDVGSSDFAAQKLDGYMTTLTDSVAQAAAGLSVQVVWVCDNSVGGDVVVGSSKLAIPSDLKGKRIGLSYGTFSHLFVLQGLAFYGLVESDVTIVNMDAKDIPAALRNNQIDAGHTWGPYITEAIKDGGHVLFSSADTPGVIVDVLNVHTNIVTERTDELKGVVRAFAQAMDFWQKNPDEANKIVAKAIGDTPENMPETLSGVRLFNLTDNVEAFKQTGNQGVESIYTGAQITSDFFVSKAIIKKAPDFQTLINPLFVQAATSQNK